MFNIVIVNLTFTMHYIKVIKVSYDAFFKDSYLV